MTRRERLVNEITKTVYNSILEEQAINEGWMDGVKRTLLPIILSTIGMSGGSSRMLTSPSVQNKIEQHRDEIIDQAVERGYDSRSAEEVLDSILNISIDPSPPFDQFGLKVLHINKYFEQKQVENYARYKKALQEETNRYQRELQDVLDKYRMQTGSTTAGYLQKLDSTYGIDTYTQADLNQDREDITVDHKIRVKEIEAEFNKARERLRAERESRVAEIRLRYRL